MSDNFRVALIRFVTWSLLLIIGVGGLVMVYPSFRRGQALKRQEAEVLARIDAKKREIAELVNNQQRFRSDADFVESIARQNRRVFPGELVFVFEGN